MAGRTAGRVEPVRPQLAGDVWMKLRNGFLLSLALLLPAAAPAASPSSATSASACLADRVRHLIAAYESRFKGAKVGASVVDLLADKPLIAYNDTERFLPASNQKLLTSAFALARLGGQFRFETRLHRVGKDLWVVGSGDPTSGDPILAEADKTSIYAEMDRWAAAVKARVGQAVEGDLVLVPCFGLQNTKPQEDYRHSDWPKNQYHCWYVAPVAGLNFQNNCFDVTLVSRGGRIHPVLSPVSRLIQVIDTTRPGGKGYWGLTYNDDDSQVTVVGNVNAPNAVPYSVAINHPPLLFGRVLAERLARAGVRLGGSVRLASVADLPAELGPPVATTVTPLGVAMARANKRSLNMAAECLFLRAGNGTWAGSASLAAATLAKEYDVSPAWLDIRDGSGLSRTNHVAAAAVTKILQNVLRRRDCLTFIESLPFAGMDGTLERRMDEPPCRGRVLGKTGYIAGVSALSGYILNKQNRCSMAYSILCNKVASGQQAKQLQDDICKLLVDNVDASPAPRP